MKENTGPKCTVQVVDMSGDKPRHVFKTTVLMDPQALVYMLERNIPRLLRVQARVARRKQKAQEVTPTAAETQEGE